MKLLTLNSHSLAEPDYEAKWKWFCQGILEERPEIMALQESSQNINSEEVSPQELAASGFVRCPYAPGEAGAAAGDETGGEGPRIPIRRDNHAFQTVSYLRSHGLPYYWTWAGAKIGYGKYDEGLALFSRLPVLGASQFYLTSVRDYQNWKTRKGVALSLEHQGRHMSFVCVHMGWWKEETDPFSSQWQRLLTAINPLQKWGSVWLMGDFNAPAHIRGEGYDLIRESGWQDTFLLADKKDSGVTVPGQIDGWRSQGTVSGMRIDYIWRSPQEGPDDALYIKESRTIFNNQGRPAVSDHYGVTGEWN